MARIALEVEHWNNPCLRGPIAMWRDSEPFISNTRGILIHRPRRVNVYKHPTKPHTFIAVRYYCGNGVTGTAEKLTFLSEPPTDALLCAVCENNASIAGIPTASQIAGRHVHVGRLKAIQTCCNNDREPMP